jgi:hypothetical protein
LIQGADTDSIIRMFSVAHKYNVSFEALKITEELKGSLLAWHHVGTLRKILNRARAVCLREKHDVRSVADLTRIVQNASSRENHHRQIAHCACNQCKADRTRGCKKPWHCAKEAWSMLDLIKPKLRPGTSLPMQDGLSLTQRQKKAKERNGGVTFDPTGTCKTSVAECFRISTAPLRSADVATNRLARLTNGIVVEEEYLTVYTDGSGLKNGLKDAVCGAGVWFGPSDERSQSIRPPTAIQLSQVGELVAVGATLREAPNFAPITIITDSKYVIEGLTEHLQNWEDKG